MLEKCIIIGPNAAGKSNLLDAIRFLRDISREGGGLQSALKSRGGLSKIRSLSSRKNNKIAIKLELSESGQKLWRYELEFTQKGRGVLGDAVGIVTFEKLEGFSNDQAPITYINRTSAASSATDQYLAQFTELEQATMNQNFRAFSDFIEGINYLHLVPQLVRDPSSFISKPGSDDYFGRDFIASIASTNANTRNAYLSRISKFLVSAIPGFSNLSLEHDSKGEPHLIVAFKSWRNYDAKQNESQLSDGTLRLIGLLWSLQDGKYPILLEEPELSLHTEIVKRLYVVISKLHVNSKRTRQVILTTHSYDLLQDLSIFADEVILLSISDNGYSTAENLSAKQDIVNLIESGFSIAESALPSTTPKDVGRISFL